MARPVKSNVEESAKYKIRKAFWELIQSRNIDTVSFSEISRIAGVNRNSLYYHYSNTKELAEDMLREAVPEETRTAFVRSVLTGKIDNQFIENYDKLLKIQLYAGSSSPMLNNLVQDLIKDTWFKELEINESDLLPEEELQINFIFAGIISLLGNRKAISRPEVLPLFRESNLGQTVTETLLSISGSST